MPVTVDGFTQEELDYLIYATLSEKVALDGSVTPLDRIDTPTYNYLMRKAKKTGDPVRGGFRFNVKGKREQALQWWDTNDILSFEEHLPGTTMTFYVGKSHLGDTISYDLVERTGIRIDYNRGIREGAQRRQTVERVVDVIKEIADDIKYDSRLELAKTIMQANAATPKAPIGLDGLIPLNSPTAGTVGGKSRSNAMFQHNVPAAAWTRDNLLSNLQTFVKVCQRRSNGRRIDWITCGDDFYQFIVDIFSGAGASAAANTSAGKFDFRSARDKAMAMGEKYKIGLPQDCFMYEDKMIVNDPVFDELNRVDPTGGSIPWPKRCYFLCTDYIGVIPVLSDMVVPHPMPYNQRVQHTSYHGELALFSILPNAQGVAYVG